MAIVTNQDRKIVWRGYVENDADVTVTFDGAQIFNGTVSAGGTHDIMDLIDLFSSRSVSFTDSGSKAFSITVNSGDICVWECNIDYEFNGSSSEDVYTSVIRPDNTMTSITKNGEAWNPYDDDGDTWTVGGLFPFILTSGDTFSCNYNIDATVDLESLAP